MSLGLVGPMAQLHLWAQWTSQRSSASELIGPSDAAASLASIDLVDGAAFTEKEGVFGQ